MNPHETRPAEQALVEEMALQLAQIESVLARAGLREGHPTLADAVRSVVDVAAGTNVVDMRLAGARLRHPAGRGKAAKL